MLKGKSLIAGICIISLAIGYIIGKGKGQNGGSTVLDTERSPTSQARQTSRPIRNRGNGDPDELLFSMLGGRSIQSIPPAEMASLIAKFSKYDPDMDPVARARQSYQFALLLAKISGGQLEEIASEIIANPSKEERNGLNSVVSAMAEKDAGRALDWVNSQGDESNLLPTVISSIARDDPDMAAHMLREAMIDGKINYNAMWSATSSVASAMAKIGADRLMAFVGELPQRQQSSALYNSIRSLSESEKLKVLDMIYEKKLDSSQSGYDFDYLFSNAYSSNKLAVEKWLEKIPDGKEKADIQAKTADRLLQQGDTEAGKEWMTRALAQNPGAEKEILLKAIQNMGYNNPAGIGVFAALLPQDVELKAEDLKDAARNSLYTGARGLSSVVSAVPDPDERAKLIVDTLTQAGINKGSNYRLNTIDVEILTRSISTMGFTGENAEKVEKAMEHIRNPALDSKR